MINQHTKFIDVPKPEGGFPPERQYLAVKAKGKEKEREREPMEDERPRHRFCVRFGSSWKDHVTWELEVDKP